METVLHRLDLVGKNLVKNYRLFPNLECGCVGVGILELFDDFKFDLTQNIPLEGVCVCVHVGRR